MEQRTMSDNMRCPRCECPEFISESYDFGTDPETGYHDAGVRGICTACRWESDIEDFQPREQQ